MRNLTQPDLALLAFAREAQEKAYAPYSMFRVGAAVYTTDGEIFQGVNVENAAYPATTCAERAAVAAAVSAGYTRHRRRRRRGRLRRPHGAVRYLPPGTRRVQSGDARDHGRPER